MDNLNFATLYGYYLLTEQGLPVYNPQYVERYGSFMNCLKRLEAKPPKPTTEYLRESYTISAESAKFFATYPADLRGKTPSELRKIRAEATRSGVCS